ncbi:UNVERIFIED_CONTAM: Pentatricopeptide repeat-containing protein OTP51, chloroplastic [Sesamum radiatum]|uniref:Pentatricopeptide repeat-containing protein OTP51, chloroplastic n=1 Tax=Sesamum radiatum TaxID=300843 RepID=A0AAW2MVX9_SESRA
MLRQKQHLNNNNRLLSEAPVSPRRRAVVVAKLSTQAMLLSFHCINCQIIPSQNQRCYHRLRLSPLPLSKSCRKPPLPLLSSSLPAVSTGSFVSDTPEEVEGDYNGFLTDKETESFNFDGSFDLSELRLFESPAVEVKELEELPEQWRRSKLAWLCKELPAHRSGTFIRVLNAQRKWIRQDDCTYVAVHCMRIRENEAAFRVYKWMMQQHWFRFDFALATKLADYMVLQLQVVLQEACIIYNQMIHLGGYKPRLSLHNSLFRALVSKAGSSCKHHLKQAEFIFHNLTTCGLKIHNDIYGGLIWLHSYQDDIDKERIVSLRAEMKAVGIEETLDVLVSVLRACAKEGDVAEAERTWIKIISSNHKPPTQAFLCLMDVYSRVGKPMKCLEIFSLHDKVESTFFWCLEKCCPNRNFYDLYLDSLVQTENLAKAEQIFNQMHADEAIGVNTRSCNTILRGYLTCGQYAKAKQIYNFMCEKKYETESSLMGKLESILSLSQEEVKKIISLKLSKEQREILIGLLLVA